MTNPVTNLDLLLFLQSDGGLYSLSECHAVIDKKFPSAKIERSRVFGLRNTAKRSPYVETYAERVRKGRTNEDLLKIVSIDPRFKPAGSARSETVSPPVMRTYLKGEPRETIVAIKTRMMFDNLLTRVKNEYNVLAVG